MEKRYIMTNLSWLKIEVNEEMRKHGLRNWIPIENFEEVTEEVTEEIKEKFKEEKIKEKKLKEEIKKEKNLKPKN